MMKRFFHRQALLSKLSHVAVLMVLVLLMSNTSSFAQKILAFDKTDGIHIPKETKMTFKLEFDLADNFETPEQAEQYFKKYNTPLTTARLDKDHNKVSIHFECRIKANWSADDWNTYLDRIPKKLN